MLHNKKRTWGFKGWVRPKLAKNSVIPVNLIGDHIYSPLFATIHNSFCHTTFLKHHILCPNFSWHTRLIPLYLSFEKAMPYLYLLSLSLSFNQSLSHKSPIDFLNWFSNALVSIGIFEEPRQPISDLTKEKPASFSRVWIHATYRIRESDVKSIFVKK